MIAIRGFAVSYFFCLLFEGEEVVVGFGEGFGVVEVGYFF